MSCIAVSILSQHSVPNMLLLKEMEGKYNEHLFITTPQVDTQRRGEQLINALGADPNNVGWICIDGNDYQAALSTLKKEWEPHEGDTFIVNLTGGTKMMSLVVYNFFAPMGAKFFYVPINKNVIYDMTTGETHAIAYRVSLKEYFALYGMSFVKTRESEFSHDEAEAIRIYEDVKHHNFFFPRYLEEAQKADTPEERRYLSGEWFEQFSYFLLKRAFGLDEESIALSLRIFRDNEKPANDNELDVAFMLNNVLHVVECKVSMHGWGKDSRDIVVEYLYKLAAVSKDFGLQVKPYLFTLHRMNRFPNEVRLNLGKRCRILGIEGIVYGRMFSDLKKAF